MYKNLSATNQNSIGFTLLEISLTLVIIALIIGGVLVGKDLVESSKINSQISQLQKYSAAVNVFKNKYSCIPGDCTNPAQFGLAVGGSTHTYDKGNGDGRLPNEANHYSNAEQYNFWYQLSTAGLIEPGYIGWTHSMNRADQAAITYPPDRYQAKAVIVNGAYIHVGGTNQFENFFVIHKPYVQYDVTCYGQALTAKQAYFIDAKLDDGIASSGKVLSAQNGTTPNGFGQHFWGCLNPSNYDITGNIKAWDGSYTETQANPDKVECLLVFTRAF